MLTSQYANCTSFSSLSIPSNSYCIFVIPDCTSSSPNLADSHKFGWQLYFLLSSALRKQESKLSRQSVDYLLGLQVFAAEPFLRLLMGFLCCADLYFRCDEIVVRVDMYDSICMDSRPRRYFFYLAQHNRFDFAIFNSMSYLVPESSTAGNHISSPGIINIHTVALFNNNNFF